MTKYAEFKDSGIEWIGEIPNDWEIKQMKHIISSEPYSMVDGPFGSDMKNEEYVDSGIPIIQLNNIGIGEHKLDTIKYITVKKAEQLKRHKAYAGEIVMAKMAEPVARATILSDEYEQYIVSADCIRVKVSMEMDPKFIVYALNSYMRKEAEILSTGTTRIRINLSITKNLHIAIPALEQQSIIAGHLDHKTADIDTLIADKQKLIDLLRESRQATISEAVTKGLEKAAKMKNSGIDWIGEIPESWQVKKLKSICYKIGDVDHKMPESTDNGIPYISPKDFTENEDIDFENAKKITKHSFDEIAKKIKPEKGDIIFARYATLGVVRIVNVDFDFLVSYSCAIIKPNEKVVNKKYLYYYLKSNCIEQEIYYYANANTQSNVGIDSIQRFKTITPPLPTQQAIADYLDRKTAQIDSLISDITEQIEKLKEFRQSIISEAVTGKVAV